MYTESYGANEDRGNLLSIQPYMLPGDYASKQRFQAKLEGYFQEAKQKGWLQSKTVVVLPEYLGTWLVAADEKKWVYSASTIKGAMRILALSNPISLVRAIINAPAKNKLEYAIFKMKAASMASIYDKTMSGLAEKYKVTIVAGSIILPSPSIATGKLTSGNGPLYNVSVVYSPNGKPAALITKVFITSDEQGLLGRGDSSQLPVINTPAGKLGVLICADSWYPQNYKTLKKKGATIVAVPSFIMGNDALDATWNGYSGFANPSDVSAADIGKITEGQAWKKYALAGRLPSTGIPYGITSCLRGQLWDLGSDGSTVAIAREKSFNAPNLNEAQIINMWLSLF